MTGIDFSALSNDQLVELARCICIEARARGEATFSAYTATLLSEAEKADIANAARARVAEEARAAEEARIAADARIAAERALKQQQGRATISVVGDTIVVRSPYDGDFVSAARAYGSWSGADQAWVFPARHEYEVRMLCHQYYGCAKPNQDGLTVHWVVPPKQISDKGWTAFGRKIISGEGALGAGVTLQGGNIRQGGSRRNPVRYLDHDSGWSSLLPVTFTIEGVPAEAVATRLGLLKEGKDLLGYFRVAAGDVPAEIAEAVTAEAARGDALEAQWRAAEAERLAEAQADAERRQREAAEAAEAKRQAEAKAAEAKAERQERLRALIGGEPVMVKSVQAGDEGGKPRILLVARAQDGTLTLSHVLPTMEGIQLIERLPASDIAAPLFDAAERAKLAAAATLPEYHRDAIVTNSHNLTAGRSWCGKPGLTGWDAYTTLTPEQEAAEAARKAVTA